MKYDEYIGNARLQQLETIKQTPRVHVPPPESSRRLASRIRTSPILLELILTV